MRTKDSYVNKIHEVEHTNLKIFYSGSLVIKPSVIKSYFVLGRIELYKEIFLNLLSSSFNWIFPSVIASTESRICVLGNSCSIYSVFILGFTFLV